MTTLGVSTVFSSAHFYAQPAWSEEKNLAEFGLCHTPHGHGHNYELWLEVELNDADPATARRELSPWLRELVRPLEHHHLNHDVPEFASLVPTTENIAAWLWRRAQSLSCPRPLRGLRLHEMNDLWVEVRP